MLVLTLIAIMAAMAIPRLSFLRYRQDAAGRLVQRTMIAAQQTAIRRGVNALLVIDYAASRMLVVEDANGNGAVDSGERTVSWKLAEGSTFAIPVVSADSYTAYYATGSGISTTSLGPTITFYPNGSASGDVFVYVGVASGRSDALRAVALTGSTGRSHMYRYVGGSWHRDAQ